MDLKQKALNIIRSNMYITLATIGVENIPWCTPVYADYDDTFNFYWASSKDSQHSQNIRNNSIVSFVIFNSTAEWGEGQGVYFQAKAAELNDQDEILRALQFRYKRVNKPQENIEDYINDAPRRIYKAVPQQVWINNAKVVNGQFIDKRVEISLL